MQYVFGHFGINLPRVTYDQIGQGQAIGSQGLRPGDLVFFDTDKSTAGPDHVGIYMGDGKMFHTPRPGKSAEIADMTSGYYMDRFMGGRRIDGVTAVGGSSADYGDAATVKALTPEERAANYGWNIAFMNSIPEVKKLFEQAVSETWTSQKFQASLRDTEWWKKTSETARQAQVMEKTDPATWNANINATTIQIQQLAAEVGAAVPPDQLKKMVDAVVRGGMQEDSIRWMLGDYVTFTKEGTLKGEAGMHQYNIKQYAASMGVNLSDDAIKNQAAMIVKKLSTTEDFQAQLREQAKSSFPGYAEQIDGGMTVKDIAAPYVQTMAKELDMPATSITVDDPLIRRSLNGLDANGKPSGLALYQFQNQLRNDPRWGKTQNAQNQAMAVGVKVLKDMGLSPQ